MSGQDQQPTMAPQSAGIITGDWELDQEILGIVRVAIRILSEQHPSYKEFRSRTENDDA